MDTNSKIYINKNSLTNLPSNYSFNSLDLAKFVFVYFVCLIHIDPISGFENEYQFNFIIQECICRVAVPFYFTCSGFLLFRKIDLEHINFGRIRDYCFKLFRLFGLWSIILVSKYTGQLWYLSALVFAILFIVILFHFNVRFTTILVFSVVLYIIGCLGNGYQGITMPIINDILPQFFIESYENIFHTTRNGLFFGTIFVLTGVVFAKYEIKMTKPVMYLGLIASVFLMICERYALKYYDMTDSCDMMLSLVPLNYFLFYFISHVELKNKAVFKDLRYAGVLVFFLHIIVDSVLVRILNFLINDYEVNFAVFRTPVSLAVVTAISFVIVNMAKKEKLRWLRYLYS